MHELSIAHSLLDLVIKNAKENDAKKIISIGVTVGKVSGILPHSLRFCFESVALHSLAEDAHLIIEEIPCRARCSDCGREYEVVDYYSLCSKCDSSNIEIVAGKELYLSQLEIE